jgi:hypothetical protein
MQKQHINERGTHTTVIEAASDILKFFDKENSLKDVTVSPGKIEGGVGAKSKSIKFKHINNELYEMVVTHNGARQEFKVFTKTNPKDLLTLIKHSKKMKDWNINYTDMRDVHKSPKKLDQDSLDEKYRVR